MKLSDIRKADVKDLHAAVCDVIENQDRLTLGEIHAMTRVILDRAKKIGLDIQIINDWARGKDNNGTTEDTPSLG